MSHDVKNFENEVLELSTTTPVLVDFWAEWCGPCRVLTPVLEKLAENHKGEWELKKVNTEDLPQVAARYGIRSIPNVKLFIDRKPVNEFVGALPEKAVKAWLAKALPDKNKKEIDRAEVLVRAGQGREALAILEPIVAAAPENEHARALLALQLVFTDRARALALVGDIHEVSPDGLLAESVRSFEKLLRAPEAPATLPDAPVKELYLDAIRNLARQEFDMAISQFIDVVRHDRYYDDDGPRKACLAIFAYLGENHEITRSRRREFSNALYS